MGLSTEGAKIPIGLKIAGDERRRRSVLKLRGVSAEGAKTPIGLKIAGSERRRREEAHRS